MSAIPQPRTTTTTTTTTHYRRHHSPPQSQTDDETTEVDNLINNANRHHHHHPHHQTITPYYKSNKKTPHNQISSFRQNMRQLTYTRLFIIIIIVTIIIPCIIIAAFPEILPIITSYTFPPPCTHEQLWADFAPSNNNTNTKNDNNTCWNLDDEMIKIPLSHLQIWSMKRISRGWFGTVSRITVTLKSNNNNNNNRRQEQQQPQQCSIAVKTDICHHWTFRSTSCLTPGSSIVDYSLRGDYTGGGLVFAASRKVNVTLEGLVPVWGVIVDDDDDDDRQRQQKRRRRRRRSSSYYNRRPGPPPLKGIVMPLIDIKNLKSRETVKEMKMIINDTKDAARMVLGAVEGLAFMNDMGVVHGDILKKNMGIIRHDNDDNHQTTTTMVLFDHSLSGIVPLPRRDDNVTIHHDNDDDDDGVCHLPQELSEACHYCRSDDLQIVKTKLTIQRDRNDFLNVLKEIELFSSSVDDNIGGSGALLPDVLRNSDDYSSIRSILEKMRELAEALVTR